MHNGSARDGATTDYLASAGIVAVAAAAWEAAVSFGWLAPLFFPAPSEIARSLANAITTGEVVTHVAATLGRVLAGFAIGSVAGLLGGVAMGSSVRLHRVLDPFVALLHPIPKISVLPLLLVVFGIGESSKVALAALGSFFPMLISTMAGVREIDPAYFEVARSLGARRRDTLLRVVLPASLPPIFTGLRLALNLAVMLTIAGELVVASSGLGHVMWFSWQTMRVADVYAWLVVIGAVGVTLNAVVSALARRAIPWAAQRPELLR